MSPFERPMTNRCEDQLERLLRHPIRESAAERHALLDAVVPSTLAYTF